MVEKRTDNRNKFNRIYGLGYNYVNYGDFRNLESIANIDKIAFEALAFGYKEIYEFLNEKKELKFSIVEYNILNNKVISDEIGNILSIKPEYLDYILINVPELIPIKIKEMFLF